MPDASELNNIGVQLLLNGDHRGARLHFWSALRCDPMFFPALANYGLVLAADNSLEAAEAVYGRLVNYLPFDGNLWNNYGNVLTRREKYTSAFSALKRAGELTPDNPGVWHNLGLLYYRMGLCDKAIESFQRVVGLGGDNYQLRNDIAHAHLRSGKNLHQALEFYECRWEQLLHLPPWDYRIPEWQGEDIDGKCVLLHGEQGYGDSIMCARFAKNLQALGAHVTLSLPRELCGLFENFCDGVLPLEDCNEHSMAQFNFHTPMYSAMYHLGIEWEDISPAPYITPPQIVTPRVYEGDNVFNVGICWASGKRNTELDWRRRIAPLKLWLQLATIPNVHLWSLQKGENSQDIESLSCEALVNDVSGLLHTWADTAAFIAKLDLVITVDTAVAHVAAGMGKPTWMLSQYVNCWRWKDIDHGTGLPWYDTMKIYRQSDPNDWETCLNTIYHDLRKAVKDNEYA
jgi:hypothetical protein